MKKTLYSLIGLLLVGGLSGCGNGAKVPSQDITILPPTVEPTENIENPTIDFNKEFKITGDNYLNKTTVDDNNRVFYEIFTGSFSDSNGDGIGDLKGIINRLDYLNDGDPNSGKSLGIGGIWLTPIFKSPSYHKYDVSDYYNVDSDFGTNDDLKYLIKECHKRDIKLILDLPINHTSKSNDMFVKFREAHLTNDVYNPYYHYYSYYSEGQNAPMGRKFTKLDNIYYESNFSDSMPELNFEIDEVREECVKIAKNYLDMGVDGFRFDAAKYVYMNDTDANSEFWSWYMGELRNLKSDIYAVGEVWDSDILTNTFYDSGLGCFNFSMSGANGMVASTAKSGNVNNYTSYIERYNKRINEVSKGMIQYPFVSNHDMDRAAGYLSPSTGEAYIGANLLVLNPGSPFIYYGDEIAMKGTRGGSNTDANRRLKMLWGDTDKVKNPVGSTYKDNLQTNGTVKDQISNEKSLYNHYKKLILIRNANPEIARGEYKALRSNKDSLGGFISTYNGSSVMVLHNTSNSEISIDLSTLSNSSFNTIRGIAGMGNASIIGNNIKISGQTSVVLK